MKKIDNLGNKATHFNLTFVNYAKQISLFVLLLVSNSISWSQVGVWKFESAPADVLVNTQNPGTYDGTRIKGSIQPIAGKVGNGLKSLEYDNEAASIPFLFNPNSTSFSVGVWVKLTATGGNQGIVAQGGVDWLYRDNGSNQFVSDIGGVPTMSSTVMAQNVWYYVSLVYTAGSLKLYVNGNLETTVVTTAASDVSPMSIGKGSKNSWGGYIDELEIYNSALSDVQIKTLYCNGLSAAEKTPIATIVQTAGTNPMCVGDPSATFTVTPTNGGSAPTYQWKLGAINVGTNSPTYTNAALSNGDVISCVMTSNLCPTSLPVTSNLITMIVSSSCGHHMSAWWSGAMAAGVDYSGTYNSWKQSTVNGVRVVNGTGNGTWIKYDNVCMTGGTTFRINYTRDNPDLTDRIRIRINAWNGPEIGVADLVYTDPSQMVYVTQLGTITVPQVGSRDVYVYFEKNTVGGAPICQFDWLEFVDNDVAPAPTALVASSITSTSFTLNWTAPANGFCGAETILYYEVLRDGIVIGQTADGSITTLNISCLTPSTTHSIIVRARYSAYYDTPSSPLLVTTDPSGNSWGIFTNNNDIGDANCGVASEAGSTYTITSKGSPLVSVPGTNDNVNYLYKAVSCDFIFITRVTGVSASDALAKAGIMIRESLSAQSPYYSTYQQQNGQTGQMSRATQGAATINGADVAQGTPRYLKIERVGNVFTSFYSNDGSIWTTKAGSALTIPMSSSVYVGLFVNSSTSPTGTANTSTFTNVSVATSGSPITGTTSVCVGSNTTLSNASAGGSWTSGSPAVATVVLGTGVVTGVSAGTSVISYTLAGCSVTAIVTVNGDNTITLSSAGATIAQTQCINAALTPITYSTTGATGATFTNLPTGVTGSWFANVVTISGTPTVAGAALTYTVTLTGGCGVVVTASGTITVADINSIVLSSAPDTKAQTLCINTPISDITYTTTGATGASVAGLPAGVSYLWAANVLTISGAPTVSGSFPYTATLTGGCGNITASGTIVVNVNTINLSSAVGSNNQSKCINSDIADIVYATTGATDAPVTGLPIGVSGSWAGNVVTISGTPTELGSFSYTITLTGGCGNVSTMGSITISDKTSKAGMDDTMEVCNSEVIDLSTRYQPITMGGTWSDSLNTGLLFADFITVQGKSGDKYYLKYTIPGLNGCKESVANVTLLIDTTPPKIICPVSITVDAQDGTSYSVSDTSFNPTVSDLCGISRYYNSIDTASNTLLAKVVNGSKNIRWTVEDKAGNKQYCDFYVTVNELKIPNIITANGDQKNDTWSVSLTISQRVEIYNRWGQKVIELRSNDMPWDARMGNGKLLPVDSYIYQIWDGDALKRKGFVSIVY